MQRLALHLLFLAACGAPSDVRDLAPHRAHFEPVACGIDVLVASDFAALAGARVGLVTNHTGLDRDGRRTAALLHAAPNVELVALFGPEHGIAGLLDVEHIDSGTDESTGVVVHSLYGATRKPTAQMLAGLDTLVFDVQDVGTRFYTYVSTMVLCLEAAAEEGKRFVVLDRPNPIGGRVVEGPVLDAGAESFVGIHSLPVRHGLTVGELARLVVFERELDVELEVVKVKGWRRDDTFERTGLVFTAPSPNLRRLSQALLYPGIGLLEFTNVSVGRGTDTPFERIGAPWIDGVRLARHLNALELPGLVCVPVRFAPTASTFAGVECGGVDLFVTDWERFRSVASGVAIACALRDLFGANFESARYSRLLGHTATFEGLRSGASAAELTALWTADHAAFELRAAPHRLYR